jgi:ribosomal-protein-alanine N-acetyltransferase
VSDPIHGRLVRLRPVRPSDHALILRWQNEPEVWRLMDYDRRFTLQDIERLEAQAEQEGLPYIIEVDGRPIGRIGLNQLRPRDRVCSLYIFIGEPDEWGKGFGVDAILAILSHAFGVLDLHLVELWSLASNHRALRAYRSCGFSIDATLRDRSFKDGQWQDRLVLSIRRDEFEAARERLWSSGSGPLIH